MSDSDDLVELRRQRQKLLGEQRLSTIKALGFDSNMLEKQAEEGRKAVRDLGAKSAKAFARSRTTNDGTRGALMKRSRRLNRSQSPFFYKPDPFSPVEVTSHGPRLSTGGLPGATALLCNYVDSSVLDTSAQHGAELDVYEGSEQAVSHQADFDTEAGVNHARFSVHATRRGISGDLDFLYRVGFRFNYVPSVTGDYVFRPVATLTGSWLSGENSILSLGNASLYLALHTTASQYSTENDGYYYNDIALVRGDHQSGVDGGQFDLSTPSNDIAAQVGHAFEEDITVKVSVQCLMRVMISGPGFIDVDADDVELGLRVPEVHASRVECFRAPVDSAVDRVGVEEDGPPAIPDRGDPPPVGGLAARVKS